MTKLKRTLKIKNISELELLRISKVDNLVRVVDTFQEYLRRNSKYSDDLTTEQHGILQMVTDAFYQILEDHRVDIVELVGD